MSVHVCGAVFAPVADEEPATWPRDESAVLVLRWNGFSEQQVDCWLYERALFKPSWLRAELMTRRN